MSILNLFKKKPKPIVINDELGTFILKNPEKDRDYNGEINWLGMDINVSLYRDSSDALTANIALEYLHKIVAQAADWDKRLRQCAVEDMADEDGMVEIWGNGMDSDADIPPITKEEFLNRISIGFIHIHPNGKIHFDYDLDEMFTDHGLMFYADISGEISSAELWG